MIRQSDIPSIVTIVLLIGLLSLMRYRMGVNVYGMFNTFTTLFVSIIMYGVRIYMTNDNDREELIRHAIIINSFHLILCARAYYLTHDKQD